MLITIIAWIVLIVSIFLMFYSCKDTFTCKTISDKVSNFISIAYFFFVIMLALRFIYG
jgi:hypothetical protein